MTRKVEKNKVREGRLGMSNLTSYIYVLYGLPVAPSGTIVFSTQWNLKGDTKTSIPT